MEEDPAAASGHQLDAAATNTTTASLYPADDAHNGHDKQRQQQHAEYDDDDDDEDEQQQQQSQINNYTAISCATNGTVVVVGWCRWTGIQQAEASGRRNWRRGRFTTTTGSGSSDRPTPSRAVFKRYYHNSACLDHNRQLSRPSLRRSLIISTPKTN
ncbi:hypothetical protein GMORB2_2621 [Geosmithia morbida]|uniref:Uncharacterized protein n=1 Tax=Geosmithia morbida TaxID=1094350 RepID=A0A9P5CYM9_9HYPO|nr:uncharacterized protein GMORB2_2621 [Geosmithia morbida]KAF4120618.1 hypothetical protein GMORB2_2621 [Geosmithia morbida]